MFINKKKLGSNLLFYLLSIALLFIFIRVLLERFNISPTIREGLIESQDICKISEQKRFPMREDNDDGEKTADNIFNPGNDIIMEHLDNAVKYKNKKNNDDMKLILELKKSAYDKIKNTLKKSYNAIKGDCSDKNELYKKRNIQMKKMRVSGEFKDKKKKFDKDFKDWSRPMESKIQAVRNQKEREQFITFKTLPTITGLELKYKKDICKMLIEEPDTNEGNVSTKQNIRKYISSFFKHRDKIFNNIKKHKYFKDVEEDYKRHKTQENTKKKTKKK